MSDSLALHNTTVSFALGLYIYLGLTVPIIRPRLRTSTVNNTSQFNPTISSTSDIDINVI